MKRIILVAAAAIALFAVPGCKEVDENANDGKTTIVQDSLANVFPTWQSCNIFIVDNKTGINVVIGDLAFYTATPEAKAQKAQELGRMIMRIYGQNSLLTKGNLVVTKDVRNKLPEPKDGITTPIPFGELKK